ncbi:MULTISPECIES: hypothetical protein [unclassified Endozoicomonas]|uniref:hypothetical protein n=1 Tax=unclassified Endozoicomonas TaxID=2644528 RepID=UPI002148DE70|nr:MULTISPECIES: hypothetical protein [unclassified Endozoicomonas]
MAIQHGIWKMGKTSTAPLDNENQLEEQVFQDISILNPDCLLIVLQGSNGLGVEGIKVT